MLCMALMTSLCSFYYELKPFHIQSCSTYFTTLDRCHCLLFRLCRLSIFMTTFVSGKNYCLFFLFFFVLQVGGSDKKLHKDMKKSTEADLAMSKAAVKISADLLGNPLCEQDQAFLESMTALDTAMKRMDAFNQEKVNQIQKTVIDPLKKYSGIFPSLNMAVKRREQALQDYKRLQAKVEKYEDKEKTGPVMVKLHQAREELRPVREDFEAKNKQLLDEMPKFYHSRIDYFQPSFEALIRAQVVYFTEMYNIFSDLTEQIDQAGLTDEQRERETEAKLYELRALSIVADD
uniref:Bridging integrator 3 n=1 Tax=Neogobius melanostomus TaxID=47308 RepID=A0A8C6V044_9GOBI